MPPRKGASRRKDGVLRPDTTLAPVDSLDFAGDEVYVWGLAECCLRSFKEAVVRGSAGSGERLAELRCPGCGRGWVVAGSLDEKVLRRFVVLGGEVPGRTLSGGSGSAA